MPEVCSLAIQMDCNIWVMLINRVYFLIKQMKVGKNHGNAEGGERLEMASEY